MVVIAAPIHGSSEIFHPAGRSASSSARIARRPMSDATLLHRIPLSMRPREPLTGTAPSPPARPCGATGGRASRPRQAQKLESIPYARQQRVRAARTTESDRVLTKRQTARKNGTQSQRAFSPIGDGSLATEELPSIQMEHPT